MDLRKISKSYRWRLFFPMVATTWVVILVLAYIQLSSEIAYRNQRIQKQLASAVTDILSYYDHEENPQSYLTFFNEFSSGTVLDQTRISVYERERLVYSRGESIPYSYISEEQRNSNKKFMFAAQRSNNGEVACIAALSWSAISETDGPGTSFWLLMAAMLIGCVVVCYLSTGYLTRNLNALRKFAVEAANGETDTTKYDFSDDEIGQIFEEIVKLYNERAKAFDTMNREHKLAMFAVEEKARIKRQLTNNINHEIKTPVGVIRGYLDTVLASPEMDESIKAQFLSRAHSNVLRLCNLLNDVSTITRLEESAANVSTTAIDFHDLVLGVETDLVTSGALGDMEFHSNIPMGTMVKANNNLLTGVISNLMRNSAHHSHGTKMVLSFVVESENYYTFSFYDDGTGVDEEHLPHLFERFYRVDAGRSRKAGGTGLGLPIVKNAIEAMGGSISVHNRRSSGLEFMFTLEKWKKPE